MCWVGEKEVIEILKSGHTGPVEQIKDTIARVEGRGPFKRLTFVGSEIGKLKFQPSPQDGQCSLKSFFLDDLSRFEDWVAKLDESGRARQQVQFNVFEEERGKFKLPPVYDFDGQVLDGGNRTRAAYRTYLKTGKDPSIALEVVCDVAGLPK